LYETPRLTTGRFAFKRYSRVAGVGRARHRMTRLRVAILLPWPFRPEGDSCGCVVIVVWCVWWR